MKLSFQLPQGDNCNLKTKSIYLKGYQDDDKGVYIDGCFLRNRRSSKRREIDIV